MVIGSRVNMARSAMGLPALPAPPHGRNNPDAQNNITFQQQEKPASMNFSRMKVANFDRSKTRIGINSEA